MKLKGKITILIGRDSTRIEVEDDLASTTFLKIKLTPEQLCAALSRQACVECELETNRLDKIGKKHENKSFTFEITEDLYVYDSRDSVKLQELAQSKLNDGWIAEGYFRSQDSFFQKDDKYFARCTIRRWT